MKKLAISSILFVLMVLYWCPDVLAHRVIAFATFNGTNVTVEGYFSGGDKVRKGQVLVKDATGSIIARGETDINGFFSFKPMGTPPFSIILKAGPGHMAKTVINPNGIGEGPAGKNDTQGTNLPEKNITIPHDSNPPTELLVSREDFHKIISMLEALRLEIDELRKGQNEVHLRDIIGGIGYLLGIFGLIALLKTRNKGS